MRPKKKDFFYLTASRGRERERKERYFEKRNVLHIILSPPVFSAPGAISPAPFLTPVRFRPLPNPFSLLLLGLQMSSYHYVDMSRSLSFFLCKWKRERERERTLSWFLFLSPPNSFSCRTFVFGDICSHSPIKNGEKTVFRFLYSQGIFSSSSPEISYCCVALLRYFLGCGLCFSREFIVVCSTPVRACVQEKGRPEDGRKVVYKSVWALTEREREERKTGGRLIYLLAFPPFSPSTDSSERWLKKDGEGLQTLASLFSVRFLLTGFPNHIGNEIASSCLHAPEAKIDLRNTSEKRKKKSFLSSILILRK